MFPHKNPRALIFLLGLKPWAAFGLPGLRQGGRWSQAYDTFAPDGAQPENTQKAIGSMAHPQLGNPAERAHVQCKKARMPYDLNEPLDSPFSEMPQDKILGAEELGFRRPNPVFDLNHPHQEGFVGDDGENPMLGERPSGTEEYGQAAETASGESSMPQGTSSLSSIDRGQHPGLAEPEDASFPSRASSSACVKETTCHSKKKEGDSWNWDYLSTVPGNGQPFASSIDSRLLKTLEAGEGHFGTTCTLGSSLSRLLPCTSANRLSMEAVRSYRLMHPNIRSDTPPTEGIVANARRTTPEFLGQNTRAPKSVPGLFSNWRSTNPELRLNSIKHYVLEEGKLHEYPELQSIDNYVEWTLKKGDLIQAKKRKNTLSLGGLLDWDLPPAQSSVTITCEEVEELTNLFDSYCSKYRPSPLVSYSSRKAMMYEVITSIELQLGSPRIKVLKLDKSIDEFCPRLEQILDSQKVGLKKKGRPPKKGTDQVEMARVTTISVLNKIIVLYRVFTPFDEGRIRAMRQKLVSCLELLKPFWEYFLSVDSIKKGYPPSSNPFILDAQEANAFALTRTEHTASRREQLLARHLVWLWLKHLNNPCFSFLSLQDNLFEKYSFVSFLTDCTLADFVETYGPRIA